MTRQQTTNNRQQRAPAAVYSFRNLTMWEKAQELTVEIIQFTRTLPTDRTTNVLVQQIVRSVTAVAANIAEGHGRFMPRAHANHISIAKGSTCETDSWLDLMRRADLISAEDERRLHASCNELIALLTAKIRELERLQPRAKVQDERADYSQGSRFEVPGSHVSFADELASDENST